jgi:HTH-type transcriptional repressor of NAD biosynthesis genes
MAKRFKNGLCLGKFMPMHKGHIHMIREAAKLCDVVHVMVCSRLCEPIDGHERFLMAVHIFQSDDNINIIHCPDENPQYPEDNKNFWKIWYNSVY